MEWPHKCLGIYSLILIDANGIFVKVMSMPWASFTIFVTWPWQTMWLSLIAPIPRSGSRYGNCSNAAEMAQSLNPPNRLRPLIIGILFTRCYSNYWIFSPGNESSGKAIHLIEGCLIFQSCPLWGSLITNMKEKFQSRHGAVLSLQSDLFTMPFRKNCPHSVKNEQLMSSLPLSLFTGAENALNTSIKSAFVPHFEVSLQYFDELFFSQIDSELCLHFCRLVCAYASSSIDAGLFHHSWRNVPIWNDLSGSSGLYIELQLLLCKKI